MKKTSFGPEKRYAMALFELASEADAAVLGAEVSALKGAIETDAALADVLQSPVVSSAEKKAVLASLLKNASVHMQSFASLVVDNKRADVLHNILLAYQSLEDDAAGRVSAVVTTASALTASQEDAIKQFVKSQQDGVNDVALDVSVDASLIAGFKIRVGSTEFDTTVRGRLDGLRQTLN